MSTTDRDDVALLVVDVQNSFLPGGSLAVPNGHEVIQPINRLAKAFRHVVLTQDWHPAGHISFASTHAGRKPFERVELPYGSQILWPDHCVQGSNGAALHAELDIPHAQLIIRKGCNPKVDSYSTFIEADRVSKTGLDGYLAARGIRTIYIAGLATEFCVAWSAVDARRLGLDVTVVEDASRAIDTEGSLAAAWRDMQQAGVKRVRAADVA